METFLKSFWASPLTLVLSTESRSLWSLECNVKILIRMNETEEFEQGGKVIP